MTYVIEFDDNSDMFVMEGWYGDLLGTHLWEIAKRENLVLECKDALAESHLLTILQGHGVDIKLVNIEW